MTSIHTQLSPPSEWIQRWSHLVTAQEPVLDVACGSGRHLRWFAERGHPVWGVDRDISAAVALTQSMQASRQAKPGINLLQADIEGGPWPLMDGDIPRQFGGVVVTNYLWRPLLPVLLQSLSPGGVLLYETFAMGNEEVGRPARPEFLLQPGELLRVCGDLHIAAFEQGFATGPDRFIQRIAAVRPALQTITSAEVRARPLSG